MVDRPVMSSADWIAEGTVNLLAVSGQLRSVCKNCRHEVQPEEVARRCRQAISYAEYQFPPEVISYAVWLYYRFPLSLRMVEELLAARGIEATRAGGIVGCSPQGFLAR